MSYNNRNENYNYTHSNYNSNRNNQGNYQNNRNYNDNNNYNRNNDNTNYNRNNDNYNRNNQSNPQQSRRILIRNFRNSIKSDDINSFLHDKFSTFGPLREVYVPRDKQNLQNEHRGYAFVEFENSRDASIAISKYTGESLTLEGQFLRVTVVEEKKYDEDGRKRKTYMESSIRHNQSDQRESTCFGTCPNFVYNLYSFVKDGNSVDAMDYV